jgi:hypothetical protein
MGSGKKLMEKHGFIGSPITEIGAYHDGDESIGNRDPGHKNETLQADLDEARQVHRMMAEAYGDHQISAALNDLRKR